MARLLPILIALTGVLSAVFARAEVGGMFSLFTGERVTFMPESVEIPTDALPVLSLRAESEERKFVLVFDCDARNLNLPEGDAAPYILDLTFGPKSTKARLAVHVSGRRVSETTDLKPEIEAREGFDVSGWDTLSVKQILRPDGIWRVTMTISRELLEKNGMAESLVFTARWRQLTGVTPEGEIQYMPTGGLSLTMPDQHAEIFLRPPQPTDLVAMLASLAKAEDARCADRCLRRLHWVAQRDDALRGALVLALDHSDPAVRTAAAKVWLGWPSAETPGLPELKAKAKIILNSPDT